VKLRINRRGCIVRITYRAVDRNIRRSDTGCDTVPVNESGSRTVSDNDEQRTVQREHKGRAMKRRCCLGKNLHGGGNYITGQFHGAILAGAILDNSQKL